MNTQIEKGIRLVKKTAPYAFAAALAGARLVNPGTAYADTDKGTTGRELVDFYTQCGSLNIDSSHTVVVERMKVGNRIQIVESDWGQRRGECDNPAISTSSMLVRSVDADNTGIIDVANFPNPCPKDAVGFTITDMVQSSPEIKFEPSSAGLIPNKDIEISVIVDRTGSTMPRYTLSGVVECQTQGGHFIPANDRMNIIVNTSKP